MRCVIDRRLLVHNRADSRVLGYHDCDLRSEGVRAEDHRSKAFQAVVEAAADKLMVPGAMVVLRTPQGNFNAAVGTTEIGAETPPTADTHFRIASNTKTMTAALIVLLAQDGKLKFSDPVSAYVPNVPNGENITIAELLKMRSGLFNYTGDPALSAASGCRPDEGVDTARGVGHRIPAPTAVRPRRLL